MNSNVATVVQTPPATPPGAANSGGGQVDIARLLRPIPGASTAGTSLRYDPEYDQIREARREEDASLPQGVWRRDVKRANWNGVVALCADALSDRSKDLQIACWLVEGLLHRDGLAGLAEGTRAVVALCDAFWPDLFPAIDDGDLGARLAPIEWLNDKLAPVLYTLPLTSADKTDASPHSWTDYVNAQRQDLARGGDARSTQGKGGLTVHDFFASAAETPTSFYEKMADELEQCFDATASLSAGLDRWCGKDAPSLGQLRDALENLAGFVDALLAQREDKAPPPMPALPPPEIDDGEPQLPAEIEPAPARIQIRSREEAYRLLMEIADYLYAVEPHSPTPYIVQRAASWGSMPLHKLLVELTKGNNDLTALFELLGLGREGGGAINLTGERRKEA